MRKAESPLTRLAAWPLLRQVRERDLRGLGLTARSRRSAQLVGRTAEADQVVRSICPYCAVGCGLLVYVKGRRVDQIEGDPDSPISRGRLCPKGAASEQLVNNPLRERRVKYRRRYGTAWEELPLERAMDMIADRVIETRRQAWQDRDAEGRALNRTLGIASLGAATLDNEENYLIKKLFTAVGVVQVENQARIGHSATVPGLGTSFARGGSTTFQQDLQHSDCILIMGSNMAECHPVGFQWVLEAKLKGATVIQVDPRFTRTSANASFHVPIRPGTDTAFLGGIVNHVLQNGREFREYVVAYTNAAALVAEDFRDTEDLDGLFSGWDPDQRAYDTTSWRLSDQRDETLQDPRCVYQLLKRHFSRYTPEMVERVCGVPPDQFLRVAEALCQSSGRKRTSAIVYSVGWTQHRVGVQNIRTAAVLQLLLGNVGRPGGGILALRGHASIQGSTDIPTLYDLLPGYLPMPVAGHHLETVAEGRPRGYWGHRKAFTVSLLRAWFGEAATLENDFCYELLPQITGDHSTYPTILGMLDGKVRGFFALGENPAVGSANSRLHRMAMAKLDWLVVRDLVEIETASFWKDAPEIASRELRTTQIPTEVFLLPAAAHTEKDGSFTNTQRLLQWHHAAVAPADERRSELWFFCHLGRLIRSKLAGSTDPRDQLLLSLTWDYPTGGQHAERRAEAVLAEINGRDAEGRPLSSFAQLKDDGTTACGCWIYCGCYADGTNQTLRRRPGAEQSWVPPEWGCAWPANRRLLYNRASADPAGRPWSERKRYVWWDEPAGRWTGEDVPDFRVAVAPGYRPPPGALAELAQRGNEPFVMQPDGRGWLFAPSGLRDGPLQAHYEPDDSPVGNLLYEVTANPMAQRYDRPANRRNKDGPDFPYVLTTYRLTEHHTAGGMSRFLPFLAELQPEMFCEVSPQLAADGGLVNGGWAVITSARSTIEARVLVTDRVRPVRLGSRLVYQVGLPYHWGSRGLSRGDSANDLLSIVLDPNVHIQESKWRPATSGQAGV